MKTFLYLLALLLPCTAHAQLGGAYYVYVGSPGYNAANTASQVYSTQTPHNVNSFGLRSTVSGMAGPSQKMNAMGLSCLDGLIYGMQFPFPPAGQYADLYRMNPLTGIAVKLGTINPPPIAPGAGYSLINTTAGTLDQLDNYYFTAYTYTGDLQSPPYNVNNLKVFIGKVANVGALSVAPPGGVHFTPQYTELEFLSDPGVKLGFQSFLDHFDYTTPSNSDGGAEDLSIHPLDGLFYSYLSYPDPAPGPHTLVHRPIKMNLQTKTIRTVGTMVNSSPNREIAGCYFDIDPGGGAVHFFVLFTNGAYGTVDLSTGALNYPLALAPFPIISDNLRGDMASDICAMPLPLELLSLSGYARPQSNRLQWQTGKEENVDRLEVERSEDARQFQKIAMLMPAGNNSTYQYEDEDPVPYTACYRLRIVDRDGSVAYSPVVFINRQRAALTKELLIYPTDIPGSYFNNSGLAAQSVITIYSLNGTVVSSFRNNSNKETVSFSVAPGMYLVTVKDSRGYLILAQRIVKR